MTLGNCQASFIFAIIRCFANTHCHFSGKPSTTRLNVVKYLLFFG